MLSVKVTINADSHTVLSATAVVQQDGIDMFCEVCADPLKLERVVRARALNFGIDRVECETLARKTANQVRLLLEGF